MNRLRLHLGLLVIGLIISAILCSCASYSTRLGNLRSSTASGDFQAALELLEKEAKPGDLLYHLEKGSLLHYSGSFEESNAELALADELLDELYTISVSERALTFLLNDEVEVYRGEIYERRYLHFYRILNFLSLGDHSAAAVEARRLALRLTESRDSEEEDPFLRDDPFLQMIITYVLVASGEFNDAWIACRHAKAAWEDWGSAAAALPQGWIDSELMRLTAELGIEPDEFAEGSQFDPIEWVAAKSRINTPEGQLLVLFESGWAPKKVSTHFRIPVFADESNWGSKKTGSSLLGLTLANRYQHYQTYNHWDRQDIKIAYFLDVAIPTLDAPQKRPATSCHISISADSAYSTVNSPRFAPEVTQPALDFSTLVIHAHNEKKLGVLAKAFARALVKYAAHQQAEKKLGTLGGIFANVAGMATEKADTRGWLLIPGEIQADLITLPAGQYTITLDEQDGEGDLLNSTKRHVTVYSGATSIISWRSFN